MLRVCFEFLWTTNRFATFEIGVRNTECFLISDESKQSILIDKQSSCRINGGEEPFKDFENLLVIDHLLLDGLTSSDEFCVLCISPSLGAIGAAKTARSERRDITLAALLTGFGVPRTLLTLVGIEPMLLVERLKLLLAELAVPWLEFVKCCGCSIGDLLAIGAAKLLPMELGCECLTALLARFFE